MLFIVHQLLTISLNNCGDIDNPSQYKDGTYTVLWATEEPAEDFCEEWDDLEETIKNVFQLSYEKGSIPRYLFEIISPSLRPVYTIDLSGMGLTAIPAENFNMEDVEEIVLDLQNNQSEGYHRYTAGKNSVFRGILS